MGSLSERSTQRLSEVLLHEAARYRDKAIESMGLSLANNEDCLLGIAGYSE